MPKLTDKQKRFCEEYLIDLNATQAAIRAGYSKKTADRIASQNLRKLEVQQHLQELMDERSQRTEITADRVLQELAAIAFSDRTAIAQIEDGGIVTFTPTDQLDKDAKKTISGIENGKYGTKVTTYDKVKALELIGKHLGMFTSGADNSAALDKLDEVLGRIEGNI
jgi:phage terminase small subunit